MKRCWRCIRTGTYPWTLWRPQHSSCHNPIFDPFILFLLLQLFYLLKNDNKKMKNDDEKKIKNEE
jgi:hypothetical protein